MSAPLGSVSFVFAVASSHPLAKIKHPLGKADLIAHRMISVADSARLLPPRTLGLLLGQDTLTVPTLQCKLAFQVADVGVGFLPASMAKPTIDAGLLVQREVEEPRPPENFYIAWRTGEKGAALEWWRDRLQRVDLLKKLNRAWLAQQPESAGF